MTELTTLQKIDKMLGWLGEGTPGPYESRYDDEDDAWRVCAKGKGLGGGSPIGQIAVWWYVLAGAPGDSTEDTDARNIAALLNGIRPALKAARARVETDSELLNSDNERIRQGAANDIYVVSLFIEPLWQAFQEARNAS